MNCIGIWAVILAKCPLVSVGEGIIIGLHMGQYS